MDCAIATPKADLTRTLAGFFEVSTDALTVPDIDTDVGLMRTLFALEDIRGLTIGEITREDYDHWRYNYPKYDTTRKWVKVPSKELSDFLVEAFKDRLGKD